MFPKTSWIKKHSPTSPAHANILQHPGSGNINSQGWEKKQILMQ